MTKAWTGQQIYENFQDGPGPEALAGSVHLVRDVARSSLELADEVHLLTGELEASWEGAAGEQARRGVGPLLAGHETAAHHLLVAADLTERQAASFAEARNRVVPVPPTPAEVAPWAMASPERMASFQEQVVAHHSAAQNNVDVMAGYTGASAYNTDRMPTSYGTPTVADANIEVSRGAGGSAGSPAAPEGGPDGSRPAPGGTNPSGQPVGGPSGGPVGGSAAPEVERRGPLAGGSTGPAGEGSGTGQGGPGVVGRRGGAGAGLRGGSGGTGGGRGAGDRRGPGERSGVLGRPGADDRRGAGGGRENGRGVGSVSGSGGAGRGVRTVGEHRAPGREGSVGGVPAGAPTRPEDVERRTPAYLEGGDPEELFGTDEVVAPATIGLADSGPADAGSADD